MIINKNQLQSFISRYYLNGLVESVIWNIDNNNISCNFHSPNKEMIGNILLSNIKLKNTQLGINNTSQLIKLISILEEEFKIDILTEKNIANKLIINDNIYKLSFSLADTILIPKSGTVNNEITYQGDIILDSQNINNIIKAKNAVGENNDLTLITEQDIGGMSFLLFIFGGNNEYTNKIQLKFPIVNNKFFEYKKIYDSNILLEILKNNKSSTANIKINVDGIIKINFLEENIKSQYYIVANNN
jgi:hypothetical protein